MRRPLERWSASVHELLRHLERKGFPFPESSTFKAISRS